MDAAPLPTALDALHALVESLRAQVQSLEAENKLLRQKLDLFIRRYFGAGASEAFDPKQLELILAGLLSSHAPVPASAAQQAAAQATASSERSAASKPAVRQPLPEHLPTERVVIEPPEVQLTPELWKQIGEEVTEELDWKPGQFLRRLYIRPKYVRCEVEPATPVPVLAASSALALASAAVEPAAPPVVIAPLPARLIEKGLPGAGLLAHVILSKYEHHLPLYRQEKIYWEQHGVKLTRQTLAEWIEQGAWWLRPVYEAMKKSLVRGDYIQADETPIRYLDPDCPGKAQLGYLWTYSRPGAEVIFEWNTSRGRDGPAQFLKEFRGLLQTDGYGVYESVAGERSDLELVGCMTHARRKFVEAMDEDRRAAWVVRQMGQLYAVEKRLRAKRAGPRLREAVRVAESRPVLARIEKGLRLLQAQVLPKSLCGEAIGYALTRWAELCRYVEHGRVEIDNNLVENAIRPTAVGKKNFLFIGHPAAGWRSAVIYSILGSCRRYGVNPHEYLRDVLSRLPAMKITEVESITPAAWAKARKAAAKRTKETR